MSTRQVSDRNDPVIESVVQLADPMAAGEKPREAWRIGTEHEKLVYRSSDHHAPSYEEPGGIRDLLMALTEYGWKPVEENGTVIAMAWLGVPVTTPRRSAAVFKANVAADKTANRAPSTNDPGGYFVFRDRVWHRLPRPS